MDNYLNTAAISRQAGCSSSSSLSPYLRAGSMPDPDVYVGTSAGWSPARAALYVEYFLAPRLPGQPTRMAPPVPEPPWWAVPEPVYYLSGGEVAGVLGITAGSVATYRWRGAGFVAPCVRIGESTYGWDHEEVLEWGTRQGYIDADGHLLPREPHRRRSWQ